LGLIQKNKDENASTKRKIETISENTPSIEMLLLQFDENSSNIFE
jgi:hypothetical protein